MGLGISILRAGRTTILRACHGTGAMSMVRDSGWRQQRLLIIGYHGISIEDEHEWDPGLCISLPFFEGRLEQLRRGRYNVLALQEALTRLTDGTLPKRSVALTFDDGMYNFYSRAYPALREYGLPATVYLTTYYCEFNRPIYNLAVSYLLWKATPRRWKAPDLFGFRGEFVLPLERSAAWTALVQHAEREQLSAVQKDDLAAGVAESLGIDYQAITQKRLLQLMNPSEVAELAAAGVDFQLHTHRHRTPKEPAAVDRELLENKARIERFTGATPWHFCYPNGDHKERVTQSLQRHAIRSATTCNPGLTSRKASPLLLPRFIDTSGISPLTFEAWVSGVGSWLASGRSYAPAD